jgi:hypothetical protein
MDVRYKKVKIFKTQKGIAKHCLLTGCKRDAYVRATRDNGSHTIEIHLCLRHAKEHHVIPS